MEGFMKKPVLEFENITIRHKEFRNITEAVRKTGPIGDGTIVIRFRNTPRHGHSALLSILTDQYPASYLSCYVKLESEIGFIKRRIDDERCVMETFDVHADVPLDFYGGVNTVALTAKSGEGYTLYFDGKKMRTVADPKAAIWSDMTDIAPIGKAIIGNYLEPQKVFDPHRPYHGDFDFIRVYDEVLPEEWLLKYTGQTKYNVKVPIPEGTWRSEPENLYDGGMWGSRNYRIPTLLTTQKGTILAIVDQRFFNASDHPNRIHTVLRRSEDKGKTWSEPITVIAMPENAQTIDTCTVQDRDTGRIFMITDAFPETMTTFTVCGGTGWREEDGEKCRILLNGEEQYLAHPDGRITFNGQPTDFRVDQKGDLTDAEGNRLGNIWAEEASLRIYPTDYLYLLSSDDDGLTWKFEQDLSKTTKEEWMKFYGCGPGNGIQLQHGPHKGRLLFPVYFFNAHSRQSAALIYSDDHGATWHRGASPADGWVVDGKRIDSQTLEESKYETLEAQLVELPDGTILYYMRNGEPVALGAYSMDGGETWAPEENFYDPNLTGPNGQFGIMQLNKKVDGKIAYACSLHLAGENRGTVKIGVCQEIPETKSGRKYGIEWKYVKGVWEGVYAYSSICHVDDDHIGIFFESTASSAMTFQMMDLPFLCSGDTEFEPPEVVSRRVVHEGEQALACVRWNQTIMPRGKLEAVVSYHGKEYRAALAQRTEDSCELRFGIPVKVEDPDACDIVIPECCEIITARGVFWREKE